MKLRMLGIAIFISMLVVGFRIAQAQDDGHGGTMETGLPSVGPDVTIRFGAKVGEHSVACGMIYREISVDSTTISINDFRFFVSNVRLINTAGEEIPVEFTQDGRWQYTNVALLDFEDGTGLCSEAGNAEINNKIVGTVPEGEYTGILFDLGIPFELNHLDTTTAPAPLNIPAMWWNWQAGYKFVRIDMQTPESQTPAWFIHLGSTGCASSDGATPPTEPCANPNIVTVKLEGFNPVENFIIADLASLLANVNLKESMPQPPGCMSGPEDPDCIGLFKGFGLDLANGVMVEDGVQAFFRVE